MSAEEATIASDLPEDHPDHLSDEMLAQFGFFKHFGPEYEWLYAPINPGNHLRSELISQEAMKYNLANNKNVYWHLLARAIPARSFAAGSNAIKSFVESNKIFDMQALRDQSSTGEVYWPVSRVEDKNKRLDWLHSDVKNMAMPYVYKVYEKLVPKD